MRKKPVEIRITPLLIDLREQPNVEGLYQLPERLKRSQLFQYHRPKNNYYNFSAHLNAMKQSFRLSPLTRLLLTTGILFLVLFTLMRISFLSRTWIATWCTHRPTFKRTLRDPSQSCNAICSQGSSPLFHKAMGLGSAATYRPVSG